MINSNVAPFLEVTSKEEMKKLLDEVYEKAGKVNKSVLKEDVERLKTSISETLKKIESANV